MNAVNGFTVSKVRRIEEVFKTQEIDKALKVLDLEPEFRYILFFAFVLPISAYFAFYIKTS